MTRAGGAQPNGAGCFGPQHESACEMGRIGSVAGRWEPCGWAASHLTLLLTPIPMPIPIPIPMLIKRENKPRSLASRLGDLSSRDLLCRSLASRLRQLDPYHM